MTILITQPRPRGVPRAARPPRAPVDPKDPVGWVYFAAAAGCIKIGHSRRLAKRIQVLRSSNPDGAELLGVLRGGVALEQAIHERFAALRTRAEWFQDSAEIRAFVKRHCDETEARRAIMLEWAGVRRSA